MTTHFNYSIIIPHKNIPKLLERCLWSIPRRDDLQIIVVDDNSDPALVDFTNFPGLNDPFVEVIFTKEGKGAGYARNVGVSKAKGRMLLFADADDFFNYCIYDVLEEYKDNDIDLIYFKCNSLHSEKFTAANGERDVNFINDRIDRFKHHDDRNSFYIVHSVWCKLFKRDFVVHHNIRFSETPIANDILFSVYCAFYAQTVQVDDRALYCYTFRSGSIRTPESRSHSADERLTDLYENWKKMWFLSQHDIYDRPSESWASLCLLNEYFQDKRNFKKLEQKILALGFTKAYIKERLFKIFVQHRIVQPMQRIYYRIKNLVLN